MKTTQICLVLILVLGLFGCSNSPTNSVDESYAVYSAILKNIKHSPHNGDEVNLFVINEFTHIDTLTERPMDEVLRNLNPKIPISYTDQLWDIVLRDLNPQPPSKDGNELLLEQKPPLPAEYKDAVEDFIIKNKESQQLTKSFDLKQNYVLINRNDFRALKSGKDLEDSWKSFYSKHPNSAGFTTFSRVGFDAEKKHAFVYFEQSCGSLCASGSYIFLEKDADGWKEMAQQNMWVS